MTRDNVQIGMGHDSLHHKIDFFFLNLGLGLNPYALKRARMKQIIRLQSASDAELAQMGLRRDDILPYVFKDLLAA